MPMQFTCPTCGVVEFKVNDPAACPTCGRVPPALRLLIRLGAIPSDPAMCWEWPGARTPQGYGKVGTGIGASMVYTHRLAWEEWYGPIPRGMQVLHTCDNPPCVRNDDGGTYDVAGISYERHGHLWLGTNAANVADKIAKGRHAGWHRTRR